MSKLEKNQNNLDKFSEVVQVLLASLENYPLSYEEAINGPNTVYWKGAIKKETDSHYKNGTWEFVPRSSLPSKTRI